MAASMDRAQSDQNSSDHAVRVMLSAHEQGRKAAVKEERTSVGEIVFPYFSKPDWAESKLKHWPWIVFFAGAALALKVGLGLPVKFKAEFPFIEWEEGKAAEINARALVVGMALMLAGLLCSLKFLPKPDDEKDRHWPEVEGDDGDAAVLFMESPTIVDSGRVDAALRAFGREWPPMTVRWPRSSQRLIDEARKVMGSQHKLDLSDRNVQLAFGSLQNWSDNAAAAKDRCASALPSVVQRCADLPPEMISRTIQRLLVLVNFKAHWQLFRALTEIRAVAPDITVPTIWDSLFGKGRERQTLYGTSDTGVLKRAILIGIGDQPVFGPQGSVISVEGRGYGLRHSISPAQAGFEVLAEIEAFVLTSGGELPDRYEGDLLFSKVGPAMSSWLPGDGDVDVDPDLEARGETYRREWMERHPEDR
jgi:hypothetical protein